MNPNEERYGNEEDCILCHRAFVQDDFDRRFYLTDDVQLYGFRNLGYSRSLDSFETQAGWVCSSDCYNDHAIDAEEESTGIHLVPEREEEPDYDHVPHEESQSYRESMIDAGRGHLLR